MLKISKKASVNLSMILSSLFFVGLIAGAVAMPTFVNSIIELVYNPATFPAMDRAICLALAYLILVVCLTANCVIFALLKTVKSDNVFTPKSVSLIRAISWCCFLVGLLFLAVGYYFQLGFLIAFAAMFLGLCIRVVKNVIEQATEIKCENDLTV
ncbi:MAG: DUF2975 domain-containing protein [Clostridia bacterium]|nr:DUF2975 domain-containing protein [Clostridia bacterium]